MMEESYFARIIFFGALDVPRLQGLGRRWLRCWVVSHRNKKNRSHKIRLFAFSIMHIFSSYCVHVFSFYNIKHHNGVTDHKTLMSLLNIKHHSCITNWLTAPLKILFLLLFMNLACRSCQPVRVAVRPALLKRGEHYQLSN